MMTLKFIRNAKLTRALTGRRLVRPTMMMTLKFIQNVKATVTLTGRGPVRPASDDGFESEGTCFLRKENKHYFLLYACLS